MLNPHTSRETQVNSVLSPAARGGELNVGHALLVPAIMSPSRYRPNAPPPPTARQSDPLIMK